MHVSEIFVFHGGHEFFFKNRILTDVPEIEDAQGLKREAPPTTDQTHGPKWSIFW